MTVINKLKSSQVKDADKLNLLDVIIADHDAYFEQLFRTEYGVNSSGFATGDDTPQLLDKINPKSYGTTYDDMTLQSTIDGIGSNNRIILLTVGTWTISNNLTIPSNIILEIPFGATLYISSGVTLTIYSPENILAKPIQQIFSSDGNIIFTIKGEVYPQWMGCIGNGSNNDTASFQKVVNWGGIINCGTSSYTYMINNITCISNTHFIGNATIKLNSAGYLFDLTNLDNVTFEEDLLLDGGQIITYTTSSTIGTYYGIKIQDSTNINIDSKIRYFDAYAIQIIYTSEGTCKGVSIDSSIISNCYVGIYLSTYASHVRVKDCDIFYCYIGIRLNSNILIGSGNNITSNIRGIIGDSSTNRGILNETLLESNGEYNLYLDSVSGLIFNGCSISTSGSNTILNSDRISFRNGQLELPLVFGGGGYNIIEKNNDAADTHTHAYGSSRDYGHIYGNFNSEGITRGYNSTALNAISSSLTATTLSSSGTVIIYTSFSSMQSFGQTLSFYNTSTGLGTIPIYGFQISITSSFLVRYAGTGDERVSINSWIELITGSTTRRLDWKNTFIESSSQDSYITNSFTGYIAGGSTFRIMASDDLSGTSVINTNAYLCIYSVEK